MSGWDAYITNLIDSSEGIKRGAIVGLNDGAIWARSQGDAEFKIRPFPLLSFIVFVCLQATDVELRGLINGFNDINSVPAAGADLEGVHYVVPRVEENLIFGKKGRQGFFAAKTATAILIAVFEGEAAVGSAARTAVEKLAAYLQDSGY